MKVDFHIHTTYSDGVFSVEEVIKKAEERNVKILAITDHDNIDAFDEAKKIKTEIKLIAGVELTTYHLEKPVHILGYFKNNDSSSAELRIFLQNMQEQREQRIKKMIKNLKTIFNIKIEYNDIIKNALGVVGRPHLAKAISDKYHITVNQAFDLYISNDSPVFVPTVGLDTKDGIDLLLRNNAIPVLAHPSLIFAGAPEDFISMGIQGIEVFHPHNSHKQRKAYRKLAIQNNFFITGGTDFHGDFHNGQHVGISNLSKDQINIILKQINLD